MSELEKTVADILVKASNAAESAGKFAMEQLPDIAQQYVIYRGVMGLAMMALCVLALVLMVWMLRKTFKATKENKVDDAIWVPVGIGSLFLCMFAAVEGFKAFETVVLAFIAPKILLIQWAATLVK